MNMFLDFFCFTCQVGWNRNLLHKNLDDRNLSQKIQSSEVANLVDELLIATYGMPKRELLLVAL